ncbi:MAG: hypothetical protein JO142_21705 [Burkholderiales bacterium]|nr:hypothetical protein [Burkholderiales bacterium]
MALDLLPQLQPYLDTSPAGQVLLKSIAWAFGVVTLLHLVELGLKALKRQTLKAAVHQLGGFLNTATANIREAVNIGPFSERTRFAGLAGVAPSFFLLGLYSWLAVFVFTLLYLTHREWSFAKSTSMLVVIAVYVLASIWFCKTGINAMRQLRARWAALERRSWKDYAIIAGVVVAYVMFAVLVEQTSRMAPV